MPDTGLSPAELGAGVGAFVVAVGGAILAYLRSFRKPQGKVEQANIVAAALTSPDQTAQAVDTLKRIEGHLEIGNRLAHEQEEAIRGVERAVRDHCASDERSAARAADALIRTADETRRLGDTMASVISGLAKGK